MNAARLGLWAVLALGCSGGSGPAPGAVDGECFEDGSCNAGLECIADICVIEEYDAGLPDAGDTLPENTINQIIGAPISDLDILVVVDNSGSMREEQTSLAANFNRLETALNNTLGALPNIHLGVVSSDVGAGPYGIMGCTGNGDNGVLQSAASGACQVPGPENYIIDSVDTDGVTRVTNYTGTLSDTFSCIAQLGVQGCGFEQTFESMRRALNGSNAQNAGFLRDDAVLAVLMITDEDDCSAENVAIFDSDPALDTVDSTIGPLASFRCFEFGVVCDPDTPRAAGPRSNCTPRNDSQFMYDVAEYAAFLQGLKSSAGRLFFTAISGVGPVTVGSRDNEPVLEPGCTSSSGDAVPGIRVSALNDLLGMPPVESICVDDFSSALTTFGENVAALMSGQCLVAPSAVGCRITDVSGYGTSEESVVQELPSCDSSDTGACSSFTMNSANCLTGSRIQVDIDRRGTAVPAGTVVVASCPQP